jgi:hypothetical protein
MNHPNANSYIQATDYEDFMRRAFKNKNNSEPGMHLSVMKNLIDTENGESITSLVGSLEKQLKQTKMYMHKALNKYISMKKLPNETILKLTVEKDSIDMAYNSAQLLGIIQRTLELTSSVK